MNREAMAILGKRGELTPQANHLLGTDQPEQVSELLVNWLDGHR